MVAAAFLFPEINLDAKATAIGTDRMPVVVHEGFIWAKFLVTPDAAIGISQYHILAYVLSGEPLDTDYPFTFEDNVAKFAAIFFGDMLDCFHVRAVEFRCPGCGLFRCQDCHNVLHAKIVQ